MKSIMIAMVLVATSFCSAQQYVITDLGALGGSSSYAMGINNFGQIVGYSATPSGIHAFLYNTGAGMRDLGSLGAGFSDAWAINDNCQIVAMSFESSTNVEKAFLLGADGLPEDLGNLGGKHVAGLGINNAGQVVGWSYTASGDTEAFFYDNAGPMKNIAGVPSVAQSINDSGQIAGYLIVPNVGNMACIGDSSNLAQKVIGSAGSTAAAINNAGQVAGTLTAGSGYSHGFLYSPDGKTIDLGTLGGASSYAAGINSIGQVVGGSATGTASSRAFLYSGAGPMEDLNSLIAPNSGWTLTAANAINNKGQIVGNGTNPSGKTHGFLLTPVGNCQAYQIQLPVCAPIQRLAKWDGTNWVPVMPGDLSSGNIHVLVHGWGPGLRTFADDGGEIWQANDPKTGDNTNNDFASLLKSAAVDIKAVAPGDTVVAFNWLDMSATQKSPSDITSFTEAWQSRSKTDEAAADLVSALKSACGFSSNYSGKLQLFGISHGARVAALATEELYNNGKSGSVVVNQLTLGDSPEGITGLANASNNLDSVLPGIKIGRDASSTFVDNYYSYFGSSYSANNIVNVKLNPDTYLSMADKHTYPIPWYEGASVLTNNLGIAWSPLEGDAYKTLSSSYEQDWVKPDGTLDWSREYVLKATDAGAPASAGSQKKLDLSTLLTQGLVTGIPNGMLLTEHSPAYWHAGFTKNLGDVAMEFTYHFVNPGDGDQLGLWIDDQLQFIITGDLVGTGTFTSDIDISGFTAGDHILSVALYNSGDVNASVEVSNFTMVSAPEPTTIFLLGCGLFFLVKRK